jgi:HAD superfamily phosphoserine phosphatase-like hydrolase
VAPLLLAVDFDGTITMRDTLHVIVDEHGCEGVWEALEPDLRAGRITIEQAMSTQFAEVKAPPEEIHALVRDRAGVREGIHELVRFAEEEGHRLVIMSAGFRSVIDQVLGDLGLGHLEVVSNEAIFSEDGCTLVFSDDRGEICELCDRRCKRHALRVRHEGERGRSWPSGWMSAASPTCRSRTSTRSSRSCGRSSAARRWRRERLEAGGPGERLDADGGARARHLARGRRVPAQRG